MYICISVYLYICINVYLYICISVYMYICIAIPPDPTSGDQLALRVPPDVSAASRSDLVVVGPDEAVDLAVGRCRGVGGALGSGQRPAGVPVAGQSLLIQVDMEGGAKLNHAHSKQALINISAGFR